MALLTAHVIRHARLLGISRQSRARRRGRRPPHSPRLSSNRCRGLCTRRRFGTGSDPGATLRRLSGREHPYFAGYQEAKRFHGKPNPTDIGYNRDPFASRSTLDPEVEIVPRSARKSGAELIVEPNLVVPLKPFLHCRDQDVAALLHRHPALYDDAHDVSRKPFDDFDHRMGRSVLRKPRGTCR